MMSTWGGQAPPPDMSMVKPMDQVLRSGLFGPWDKPEIIEKLELPPGVNVKRVPQWGIDSWLFYPNFMLLIWEPGWFLTYHYWPTAVDKHIFESTLYFVPPSNARERLAQELAAVTFKEYALQDANTLEATQTMIGTRVVKEFLLCDQEILLRHLHKTTGDYVKEYQTMAATAPEFADLEPYLDWDLATEPERYAKRLASTMAEMQAFYDVAFPRLNDVIDYCDKFPLDDLPEDAKTLMHIMQSLVMVSFPIEAWKQPRVPDSGAAWVEAAPGTGDLRGVDAQGRRAARRRRGRDRPAGHPADRRRPDRRCRRRPRG